MAYAEADTLVFTGLVLFLLLVIYPDTKVSAHGSSTHIREPEVDMEKTNHCKTLSWSKSLGVRASKLLPTIGSGVHLGAKGPRWTRPLARTGSGSVSRPRMTRP
ncbi:hypothetical protein FNV43_RR19244 [Rhamnella rubrinervis]|uniref:Uncharacterized protein n=1 Tax=Rhamnella rubrinervis TaxID=2594499 RepID=A0A8K0E6N9_9ROSA|nr:hypothetical protein FNV43_RR19244 [Rhamnella rubrinervis]